MAVLLFFIEADATDSFSCKAQITGQADDDGEIDNVEIMVPLMPLNNCEINLILPWSANCVIFSTNVANQVATFTISETKLYISLVTLTTQDNTKL